MEVLDQLHQILKKKHVELGLCEVKGNFRKVLLNTPLPRRVSFNIYPSVAATIKEYRQEVR